MAVLHMVMWQLNGQSVTIRSTNAARMALAFEALIGKIPGLLRIHAGANSMAASDAWTSDTWDMGLVMVFDSHESLAAYQTHQAHLAIKTDMGSLRRSRAMVDIDIADSIND
jgi:galactitol-specific phosphotransferase system IIC component